MRVTLKKLSVCPCGFPALAEHIPLGTEYDIRPDDEITASWTCGGCKKTFRLDAVYVCSRAGGDPGYLPKEIFQPYD